MPGSIKLRPLPFIGTLLLVVTLGFFIGRYSVGETEPPKSAAADTNKPTKRPLTALDQPAPARERAGDPVKNQPTARERIELSEREEEILKTVSDYIADASEKMDDLDELGDVIKEWLVKDPDSAIEWLARGERRDDILRVIFTAWVEELDSDDARAWLAAHRDTEGYSSAVLGFALGLSENEEFEEALALADTIDDPLARTQIWNAAGGEVYDEDPDGTLLRLADSGLPEDLQIAMVEEWTQSRRNKSRRNAQNLASVYSSAVAAGADFEGRSSAD